jgi:hypothetical protein
VSHTGIPQTRLTSISISAPQPIRSVTGTDVREIEQLTQERLEEVWAQLIEKIQENKELYDLIADKKVELKSNNLFHIQVPNLYLDTQLQKYKMQILEFIRKETGNEQIMFKAVVVTEHVERKAYLPNEKFEEMLKRNPSMLTLRKLFPDIDL